MTPVQAQERMPEPVQKVVQEEEFESDWTRLYA